METAVTRLETMFQKAESDLDYIQHKLEFEIMKNLPDNPSAEENPVTLLEEFSVVKSRYKMLCTQLEEISIEQRESMSCIHAALENTMKMVQALQRHADLELSPLSEEERTAAQHLACKTVKGTDPPVEEPLCSVSTVPIPDGEPQFKPVTKEMLMAVPKIIRSTVKLVDLNSFYRELFNYFVLNRNRAALSVAQMNKMHMKATSSRLQILKELSIVEIDKQGNAKLIV
ncbi:spindle and kinetochore-associated protein 2 isoform X2 [Dermochelys coriacea]|uniref:spindle and kinetochore-associated protein 2 isoform X2 n=1 Tax=Dermochelys coriacea TaxID=27794 RepID=UPI0018E7BE0A|nr:spindle and kinetochore-associated protein 2 isoform X2 [Dermochelys coriacea]